jgi:hypothetical protein
MADQPFDDSQVLFRFVPTEEEQREGYGAEECVVTAGDIYCRFPYDKRWGDGYEHSRYAQLVIARLLSERSAMQAYIGSPGGPSYEELVKEND